MAVLYQAWQRRGWFQLPLRFRDAVELRCDGAVQPRPIYRAYQAETGTPADDDARVRHVALGPLGLGSLAQPAHARLFFCSQLQPNTTLMACWGLVSAEPPRL